MSLSFFPRDSPEIGGNRENVRTIRKRKRSTSGNREEEREREDVATKKPHSENPPKKLPRGNPDHKWLRKISPEKTPTRNPDHKWPRKISKMWRERNNGNPDR